MAALVAAAVLLGGCGLIGSIVNTTAELQRAGFSSVRVSLNPVSSGRNAVEVSVSVAAAPADATAVTVARVAWNNLHEHFDALDVTINGHGPSLHRQFSFAALVGLFGPRNPAWDRTSIRSSVQNTGYAVLIGLLVVAVVAAAVIVLVVRHHRRRSPSPGWSAPAVPRPPPEARPGASDDDGHGAWGAPAPPE